MKSGQVRRLGIAGGLLYVVGCAHGAAAKTSGEAASDQHREEKSASPSGVEPQLERSPEAAPSPEAVPNSASAPSPDAPPSDLPAQEAANTQGLKLQLDDGSHVIIPYGDEGLDRCSMVRVHKDGKRSPHRPPDVREKCANRWRQE